VTSGQTPISLSPSASEDTADVRAALQRHGYWIARRWNSDVTTMDLGALVGTVLELESLLPGSGIPTVQTLRPRRVNGSLANQYSGRYGLSEFPLHTDLALWARPPRYFLLRCCSGSKAVETTLLPSSSVVAELGIASLRRAVVRPRRPPRGGVECAPPVVFEVNDVSGFRWDPLFLVPMNRGAEQLASRMLTGAWGTRDLRTITLEEAGDTLILDNWRLLHGRSPVTEQDSGRRLERVYLTDIHA
jgi:L-asparagine oxygenase